MAHGVSLKSLAKEDKPSAAWPVIRRMLAYLRPFRSQVAIAIAWLVVGSVAQAVQPALTGWIIDVAVEANEQGSSITVLATPFALLLFAVLVGWWAQRVQILLLGLAGQKALFSLRADVFARVQELSVSFFDQTESGDLMSRLINDIETINSFLSQGFRRVLGAGIGLAATLAGMFIVEWRLALATLLVVPVMLGATALFSAIARRAFQRRQESIGDVSATLAEELEGIKVAQAFARTGRNRDEFGARNAANRDASITASAVSSAFSPTLAVISAIATALVAVLGGWLAIEQVITVGVVVAFFAYSRAFFNAVSQLSSLYAETQSALAGGERVFSLMDSPAEVTDSIGATALDWRTSQIEFSGVSFAYGDGPEVLHDVDLVVEPGTNLAIVGATGAGKTTLANLVSRFYDPMSGTVAVDGRDLRDVTIASLRDSLGIVLQEPFLFRGTIADNIRYGRLDATDAELQQAARTARAIEFIERLPEGFDTEVGERGATLSTGQRQLIAFARAILADPDILILDEATSSVDTRTEALIQQALRRVLENRTALIIAHRLSTVRDADRIIVIEDGRIVEDGSFVQLIAADGAFARLHAAQFAV